MSQFEHSEGRPATFKDVEAILRDLSKGDRGNPVVLAINCRAVMQARNNGYPMDMYHATLPPVQALTEEQTNKLMGLGYVTHYIHREYPKVVYRFNPDAKFGLKRDAASGEPTNVEHVEERTLKTEKQHADLKKERVPKGCGPWVDKVSDIKELSGDLVTA